MKRGSYSSYLPYGTKHDESNDIFRLIYNVISNNNLKVVDFGDTLTQDNYVIHEKHILIENSDYYLSYMQNTGKKSKDLTKVHCNMNSNLRSALNIINTKNSSIVYSFTKAAQISGLLGQIRQKQRI